MEAKRHLHAVRGFTLIEMLVVCMVILVLVTASICGYKYAKSISIRAACMSNLNQTYGAMHLYHHEYGVYPVLARPDGLGDRANWGDLFGHLGTEMKDETRSPRLPRLLEGYAGDVGVLLCPGQGGNARWRNVGPYYYNTNDPFATDVPVWSAMADRRGMRVRHALAGCQSPVVVWNDRSHGWRHGSSVGEGGINNHVFADGSTRSYRNPSSWDVQDARAVH